jgi:hypothetical protein
LAVPRSATTAGGAAGAARLGSGAGASGAGAAGAGAAADPGSASRRAPSTSALTIRPPGPVPLTAVRSMPCSRAMRRATGDALMRPFAPSSAGAAAAGAAAGSGGGGRLGGGRRLLGGARRDLLGGRVAGRGALGRLGLGALGRLGRARRLAAACARSWR